MKNKHVLVHANFSRPPLENPWLGELERDDSAAPYRDSYERAFEECYGPNGACPALDEQGRIVALQNNYARMSFSFAQPLLSWLERKRPESYRLIVEAAAAGRGLAQPFVPRPLPGLPRRDKRLLVRWGLDDFSARFGRASEGLWLPELAVDDETLDVLAEEGVRFTLLAPSQVLRFRDPGGEWREASEIKTPPTRPYLCRGVTVLLYHEKLSEAGPENLARGALARFLPDDSVQLVTVAGEGERYSKAAAAALATSLRALEQAGVPPIAPAEFALRVPAPQEIEVRQTPAEPAEVSEALVARYEREAGRYFRDYKTAPEGWGPAFARGERAMRAYAREQMLPRLPDEELAQAIRLLELHRLRLTSPAHAAKAADAAHPARVDLARAAAHFALCLHIDGAWVEEYGFEVERLSSEREDVEGLAGADRSTSRHRLRVRRRSDAESLEAEVVVRQKDRVDFEVSVNGAAVHTLEAMFRDERAEAVRLLLPGPGDSPARRDFLKRWRAAVARLVRAGDDEPLALLAEAPRHGLAIAQLPWRRRLSEEAVRVFAALETAGTPAAVSRASRWLEACEAAGLPVSLWRLRALYWRWRTALGERAPAPGEREAAVALGEKLGFSDSALPLTEVSK